MSQQQFLTKLRAVLDAFEDFDFTPSQFFGGLLTTHIFEDRQTTISLAEDVVSILEIFNSASSTSKSTERWIFRVAETKYKAQVLTFQRLIEPGPVSLEQSILEVIWCVYLSCLRSIQQ